MTKTGRTDDKNLIEDWLVCVAHNNLDFTSNADFRECIFILVENVRADENAALTAKVEELENELKDIPILQHQVDAFQAGREDLIVAIRERVDELEALIFRPYRLKWIDKEKVLAILDSAGGVNVKGKEMRE